MIVRGAAADIQENRAGMLSAAQTEQLQALRPFQLAVVPSLLAGVALMIYGGIRADVIGWIVLALGAYLALSGWRRYQQRQVLKKGAVRSFVGLLERIRPSPLRMFEGELIIDGQSFVLLSGLGAAELQPGSRYRVFVVEGLARMGVIVGMEVV